MALPISNAILTLHRYAVQFCRAIDSDNYARVALDEAPANHSDSDSDY